MSSDFYQQHLREFPSARQLFTVDSSPSLGSVSEFIRLFETRLDCELTLVRAGGTIPDNADAIYPVTLPSPRDDERGRTVAHLALCKNSDARSVASSERCCDSFASLLADLYNYAEKLREAQGQLALPSRLPTISTAEQRLSGMIQQQLETAVRLVGASAGAIYILQSTERLLVLRGSVGLPTERLLDPPRPLYDAAADLEAMLGYAVIINEDYLQETWQSPEPFPTAVCVPVSSSTSILGTAWFYFDRTIDVTDHQTDILEMSVGRIASEIERVAAIKAAKTA
ncbi:MAG: GAF domain-containing protein [Thermoguttaceae bacterium]